VTQDDVTPTVGTAAPRRIVLRDLFGGFSPLDYGTFGPFRPGIEVLPLYGLNARGDAPHPNRPSAALLRYAPGASVPAHRHPGYEHIFVIAGSQSDQHGHYPRGTCLINAPGSGHAVTSPSGCLVLALWNHSVEMDNET
jgi:hypothetical protein